MNNNNYQYTESALGANLRRLIAVRMIAIVGESAVVAVAILVLNMQLPLLPLVAIIATHFVFNVISWLWLRGTRQVTSRAFFIQLCVDVAVLALLLYFAGGATNPFVSLLLLPLVVAATVLSKAYAWAMGLLVVTVYGVLMMLFQSMPHIATEAGHDFDWHVIGMWFSFLLAVALIIFFVLRMAESLRERDRVLAEARERSLRDEQLVALGTLAAGAAHELGTPLSTLAVVANDLLDDYGDDEVMSRKLNIMRQQVERCKNTLAVVSVSAGQVKAGSGGRARLDSFLEQIVSEWRAMRPEAELDFQSHGLQPAPWIVSEESLSQAIVSFLNNAADASNDTIEMQSHWNDRLLTLEISDRGEGLSPELLAQVGKVPFTTKAEGKGLGLFLAHAVITRLGGEVIVSERNGGGSTVHVKLPLEKILVAANDS